MQLPFPDSGPAAEPSTMERLMIAQDAKLERERVERGESVPKPQYRFNDLGRNQRIRVKLGKIDEILASETGWLSRACLSLLDGALSGFLDAVRVQSRARASGAAASRSGTRSTPSSGEERPHPSVARADKRRTDRHRRIH